VTCPFCEIAQGRGNAQVVLENPKNLAFLDARPVFPGHTLLIPKAHYATMADLPESEIGSLFADARRLAMAVETAMAAEGTFVAVNNRVSQSVPHLHVHVVPRRRKDGLRGFFWPRQPYRSTEEMASVADGIRAALALARHES